MTRQAHPRDLTDQQWSIIEPLLPPAKSGGYRRSVELRTVVNGIFIQQSKYSGSGGL